LGLKFHICAPIAMGVVGVTFGSFTKKCGWWPGDNVDTNFAMGAPYKVWDGKKCPKFCAIFGN